MMDDDKALQQADLNAADVTNDGGFDDSTRWLRAAVRNPLTWLALLILYVLYSRIWDLSVKVMHHDESLFAYYGYWLYRGNGYHYQPILHGPVLQDVSAFFFLLFGDDQWTMRLPSLVGGLLMFPVAWRWKRYIGGMAGVVAVTGLIAFSPSIAFYTRFLRNDIPYLTATMWCALCVVRTFSTGRPKYVWGSIMAATLMFCMMESSIFFFAACIGYLVTMTLVDLLVWRKPRQNPADNPEEARHGYSARATLRYRDFFYCAGASAAFTLFMGWLFYRVFYSTLPIFKPVIAAFHLIHLEIAPRTANYMIVAVFFVAADLIALALLANARRARGRYGLLGRFGRVAWTNRWHAVAATAVAVIIYTTVFTTFFTFTETASFDEQVRDFQGEVMALTPVQIYKNTWDYWWDQHKLHRIKGPFHYYLPILLLYELPIIGLALLTWLRTLARARRTWLHIVLLLAMHALLALAIWAMNSKLWGLPPIDWAYLDKEFHLTSPAHLFLILLYAQLLIYIAPMMYGQGRRAESFITYWGVTSLFAYSYAGEKVPWLTVHTVGPLALLAASELALLWKSVRARRVANNPSRGVAWRRYSFYVIAIAAVVYQARNNHLLLFVHPWSPAERLVYNHTSPDMKKAVAMIDKIGQKTNFGDRLPIYMQGEMGWPMHWYLRDYDNIIAPLGETADNTTRPVAMVNWDAAGAPNLRKNYNIRRMKVREWWEPEMLDLSAMSDIYMAFTPQESRDTGMQAERYRRCKAEWRKLWHYLAYREIWIDPENPAWSNGANEFAFCVRKDIAENLLTYDWLAVTPKRPDVPVFIPY